ncbi:uncharacterized protein LOC127582191 isoform X2 [Pristis pectinata]|uniref:uncharacterized protein LOC127582191 isoform X2 n=1 Tax=Pristis pectinata TaxID=685728 RepID=UPI00223E1CB1|nr:uncharacterized protein LOC127582191 isoform X2 [Pristis pectinata]
MLKAKEGLVYFHATNSAVSEAVREQIGQFLQLLKNRSLLYETEARNIPKRLKQNMINQENKRQWIPHSSCKNPRATCSLPEDEKETDLWKQMYLLLFGPVNELLDDLQQGSNILIVPDKYLIQIPFANLPDLKNKTLAERFWVTLAPSLFAVEVVANLLEDARNKTESRLTSDIKSGSVSTMTMLEHMGGSQQELHGLQKVGLMDTVSHLVHCTSTNTIVASSPYIILPFKQVVGKSRALVLGSPHFPSALSLWGRLWKPWGPLIGAQKEVIKVAEYLQTEAVMGEQATKKRVLSELPQLTVVHIGASTVLMQIKSVPLQASLTFYHHFYIALWYGSLVSYAVEYAKHQMQNDARFGRYWCSFVLLGFDAFVSLQDIKCDMLHQAMENAEQEVAQRDKKDWLNPEPYAPPVPDQEELLSKIQKSVEELLVNQGSMSAVLKLLHLLMSEAARRLSNTNTDHCTVKLTANIISIPGVYSTLKLLGFHFQSLAPFPPKVDNRNFWLTRGKTANANVVKDSTPTLSHAHPVAVLFPHWNQDKLLRNAQQVIAALIDLSACKQCVNALIWILPLTCDVLEQLITLLEKSQSSPMFCLKLTEKGVAALWNKPHIRDFLQVIGYEQAGLFLLHNPRTQNKSLLLGSLNLFLALHPQSPHRQCKLDPQDCSSADVRVQQSTQCPQEPSALREDQSTQGPQETSALREDQSTQGPQETSALRDDQFTQGPQETSALREDQSTQDPQETSVLRGDQSTQCPQETSALRGDQSTQVPQETWALRVDQSTQGPQETSALRKDQSTQGSQETSALREDQSTQDPQETSALREDQSTQDPQETSALRKDQSTQGSQDSSALREDQSTQGPQETSAQRENESTRGPQESLLSTDEQSSPRSQESLAPREEQSSQGPQEPLTGILRVKKGGPGSRETPVERTRIKQGLQEATGVTARGKKTKQGPRESAAKRNMRNRCCPLETSLASDKPSEQEAQESTANFERKSPGNSKVCLNTLKPLLVLRHQIMMQAPWLTVKPTSEEVQVKRGLAHRLTSLRSQQQAHIRNMELWYKRTLKDLEGKPEKSESKTQACSIKKVKVKGPRTPSSNRTPIDAPTPVSQTVTHNLALRSAAHQVIKEQEGSVQLRHRAEVNNLFMPFIDPMPDSV